MEANPQAIRLEDLLVHAAWVRGLARHLVADPHAAEDVVQDTWVAALRTPPREDRNLRGWLGQVVRNVVRQRGRGNARRAHREGIVATEREPVTTPEELAARVETQRRVAALVLELDEPYRQTLLYRYYEGHSSAEIARRLDVPAGTVRWRLSRGRELLRERLDDDLGGRRAWIALLAPLARRDVSLAEPTGTGLSALVKGILAMHLGLKVSVAAVGVVLALAFTPLGSLALGLVTGFDRYDAEPVEVTFRPVERTAPPAVVEIEGREVPRVAVDVATEEPAAVTSTGVALRVLDPEGRPVAGASVRMRMGGSDTVTTDDQGRATVLWAGEFDLRYADDVLVDDPRFLAEEFQIALREGEIVSLGDVTLGACGAIEGRVVDASGMPVSGAGVTVDSVHRDRSYLESTRVRRTAGGINPGTTTIDAGRIIESGRTDDDGRFLLPRVPVGMQMVWAAAEGHMANHTPPVEVRADSVSEGVVVELGTYDPADFIGGIVLDPGGDPVPHAEIQIEYRSWMRSGGGSTSADDEGRFLLPYDHDVPRTLRAADREGRWSPAVRTGVEGGEEDLVLQLTEPVWMAVTVTGPSGPVEGARMAAYDADHRSPLASWDQVKTEGAISRFIVPDEPFLVEVECEGYDVAVVGPYQGRSAPREIMVELRPLPGVRGRVIADGEPMAGARLELSERTARTEEKNGFPIRVKSYAAAQGTTGEEGTFSLTLRKAGTFYLRAQADGFAPTELGPLDIDPERGLQGLEIALGEGGTIEGRVLVPAGESPAGVIVAISRGDGHATTQRVGADGAYRFEHLIPGAWNVVRRDAEITPSSSSSSSDMRHFDEASILTNCTVVDGETTRFDLDLAGGAAEVVLEGSLTFDGAAARGWEAQLAPAGRAAFQRDPNLAATIDDTGSFRIVAPAANRYRLLLSSPDGAGPLLNVPLELFPGINPWSRAFPTGVLVVENPAPPSEVGVPLDFFLATVEGVHVLVPIQPGEDGTARIAGLPAGNGRIARFTLEEMGMLSEFPADRVGIVDAVIRAGETTTVRLP